MLIYCLKCRKNAESKNPKVVRTKNGRIMLLSKCEMCNGKKSKFIKEHEARELLSNLGIRTPLSQILWNEWNNKQIFISRRWIYEMHLKQPGFTYSSCVPFTKNKDKIEKNLKKQEIQDIFIKTH